jgi:peptide/nickel transport system substrate-binding protein
MYKKVLILAIASFLLLPMLLPSAKALDTGVKVPNWGHFIFSTIGDPENTDPAWIYDTASSEMIFNVYETLIFWPFEETVADPYRFEGHMADDWIINPAGTMYTFHIRPNVPYQNPAYGNVKPEDVEYSIERGMILDHVGGPQWMLYFPLLGTYEAAAFDYEFGNGDDILQASEEQAGGIMIDNAVQVNNGAGLRNDNVVSATQDPAAPLYPASECVTFYLGNPYSPFMQILAQTWAAIMPKQWGADLNAQGRLNWPGTWSGDHTGWQQYNQFFSKFETDPLDDPTPVMMGSGPYKFTIWEKGDYYQLDYFPDYYRGWPAKDVPGATDNRVANYITRFTHKLVPSWTTRKLQFLSDDPSAQSDMADVPRSNIADVLGQPGVRGVREQPTLSCNPGIAFNYQVATTSVYFGIKPTMGGATKLDLLSDIHMRRAIAFSLDYAKFLIDALQGEASQPSSPLVSGLAFWNASKDLGKPQYSIAAATAEFQAAWGGQVWSQGFTLPLTYNSGNTVREIACKMLENTIETKIAWPTGVTVDTTAIALPWGSVMLPAKNKGELTLWEIGWIADFADPANFIHPYMHTAGDFTKFQHVHYGDADDFHPTSGRHYPYVNALGETVTRINNTYVDNTITAAAMAVDPAVRQSLYDECVDIWQAEFVGMALAQTLGRHWERDWLQSWYYNPICQGGWGVYVYHYFKGMDTDMTLSTASGGPVDTLPDGTPVNYGYIDIKDKAQLNAYWWDGYTAGTVGYNRLADVWWAGRSTGDCKEMNGEYYMRGPNPLPNDSWYAFKIPAGSDGFVDIFDKARLNFEWHNYVVPV